MLLNGRRLSEWATDTKVIPENESSEELSLLEHKNQSSLITYKRGFLVISIFIFSVFYYQIKIRVICKSYSLLSRTIFISQYLTYPENLQVHL